MLSVQTVSGCAAVRGRSARSHGCNRHGLRSWQCSRKAAAPHPPVSSGSRRARPPLGLETAAAVPVDAALRADDAPVALPGRVQALGAPTAPIGVDDVARHLEDGDGRGVVVVPGADGIPLLAVHADRIAASRAGACPVNRRAASKVWIAMSSSEDVAHAVAEAAEVGADEEVAVHGGDAADGARSEERAQTADVRIVAPVLDHGVQSCPPRAPPRPCGARSPASRPAASRRARGSPAPAPPA